jgi:hypothetical protein
LAFSLARAKAGNKSDARIAMMAITTSNSINVKPLKADFFFDMELFLEICFVSAVMLRACA